MMIGELAKRAGVNIETVRYYERRGILPRPARTPSGYRQYEPDALARLQFIRRARGLGFSLCDVQQLLALRRRPDAECEIVDQKAREKLARVREKIAELTAVERSLSRLASSCDARRPIGECPILQELEAADASGSFEVP
ncbi:MAG: heavy metal-responsive transcriptional regulator [Gemmatimonadaceae bacterium]